MALAARRRREWLEDERLQAKIGAAPTQQRTAVRGHGSGSGLMQRRQQAAQVAPKVGGALPGGAAPHQHAGGPYEHMRMSKLDSQRARAACPASHFHSKAYYA